MAFAHSKILRRTARFGLAACCAAAALTAVSLFGSATAAHAQNAGDTALGSGGLQAPSSVNQPVGAGDVLHIEVAGQSDLTNNYTVDNNGQITMPYIGKVQVSGLSLDAATTKIRTSLGQYYNNPVVTLSRTAPGGNSITLTGALAHQGTQSVRRDARLNDVVQLAGPTSDADLTRVQVTSGLPGQTHQTATVDLTKFLNGGDAASNPTLADGDVVFVPNRSAQLYSVSVVGEVKNPHRYDVQPNTTVYDLITLSGGLTDTADRSAIYIQPSGTLDRKPVNYDQARSAPQNVAANPVLSDGDKVVVPEVENIPTFSITGAVLKPGQYPLQSSITLTQAEGLADGLADRAQVDKITITRETPRGAQVLKVNAKDPTVAANFLLQPGDNVFIPQGKAPSRIDPFQAAGLVLAVVGLLIAR